MKGSIEAIYEHGVFNPLKEITLPEKQHVQLVVKVITQETRNEILELASQVYNGLSNQDIDDVEKIALNRREFFKEKET
ncbi:MAG: antitoxin family protein [bacterium]